MQFARFSPQVGFSIKCAEIIVTCFAAFVAESAAADDEDDDGKDGDDSDDDKEDHTVLNISVVCELNDSGWNNV